MNILSRAMKNLRHDSLQMRLLYVGLIAAGIYACTLVFEQAYKARNAGAQEQNGQVQLNLDHFKCYEIDGEERNKVVFLQDQFDLKDKRFETVKVEDPEIFCNPTRKIHGGVSYGVINSNNHLTGYEIDPVFDENVRPRKITVRNQFGEQALTVRGPEFLFVPTQKTLVNGQKPPFGGDAPSKLDHFKCYEAVSQNFERETVVLQDQFDIALNKTETVRTIRVKNFCNPVRKIHYDFEHKNFIGIQNPKAHLTCYDIRPKDKMPFNILVNNQFGPEQKFEVRRPEILCVPSEKIMPEPIEIDTFSTSTARILLLPPQGDPQSLEMKGTSEMHVFFEGTEMGQAVDDDGDGLDDVSTEMVSMNLTGGGMTLMVRSPNDHPNQHSMGMMEETANTESGNLDVPPFAPAGAIDSFFDVFTEITLDNGAKLHNIQPYRLMTTHNHKPPLPGETYTGDQTVPLYDENNNPTGYSLGSMSYTPDATPPAVPPVGT